MMIHKALLSLCVVVVLTGCSGKSFDYHPASEIPKGPGLFSGEKGAFVLSSDKKEQAAATPSGQPSSPEEFREFQEYQEFRRWKESAQGTPALREFEDWREWKAYRSWKQGQSK